MRSYKEFLKNKEAERANAAELQQKGQNRKWLDEKVAAMDKEIEEHQERSWENREQERQQREEEAMRHDMRDQALGQISGIAGADIDYDELGKMAKNHVRDADELVSESLQNDGYTMEEIKEIHEVMDLMKEYLHDGSGLDQICQMNENYTMDVIARAYIEVAKQSSFQDIARLERISDICNFGHPAYERIFDRLQNQDPGVGEILDKLDMAIGNDHSLKGMGL